MALIRVSTEPDWTHITVNTDFIVEILPVKDSILYTIELSNGHKYTLNGDQKRYIDYGTS